MLNACRVGESLVARVRNNHRCMLKQCQTQLCDSWIRRTLLPGRHMRRATSAAMLVAAMTSAFLPVTSPPPTMMVVATGAMKPSMCTPRSLQKCHTESINGNEQLKFAWPTATDSFRAHVLLNVRAKTWRRYPSGTYILTTSPVASSIVLSLSIGELWQMQLLTDMHVGNAIPAHATTKATTAS